MDLGSCQANINLFARSPARNLVLEWSVYIQYALILDNYLISYYDIYFLSPLRPGRGIFGLLIASSTQAPGKKYPAAAQLLTRNMSRSTSISASLVSIAFLASLIPML